MRNENEKSEPAEPAEELEARNAEGGVVEPEEHDGTPSAEVMSKHRRKGNVARLPKAVRDKINVMIEDGVPYRAIIERLGEDGNGLDKSNLSRWKDGGYEDWLAEQAFIARTRMRQETPKELVRDFDATEVNHAALQLGTLHIFDALRELGPGSLDKKLGGDCAAFARLLNALARASRETMQLQKYRDACARARAALHPLKDVKRKLTDDERRAIVLQVDDILGLNSQGPYPLPGGDAGPEPAAPTAPSCPAETPHPGCNNADAELEPGHVPHLNTPCSTIPEPLGHLPVEQEPYL